jgi:hypothetical protein
VAASVLWRVASVNVLEGSISYAEYFPRYRSPFHLTCESLVLGFAIAWMSRQTWSSRISRAAREALFWVGAAGVVYWLVPSVILETIEARTIVVAPALIGLCFGAMVLAAVSGSGSYSIIIGRAGWRPLATGSYALYLTHIDGAAGGDFAGSARLSAERGRLARRAVGRIPALVSRADGSVRVPLASLRRKSRAGVERSPLAGRC